MNVCEMKDNVSLGVRIVDFEPKYQPAFKSLNEEWIKAYFEMEEADRAVLDHPEENIIKKGGKILVALHHDEPVGVCALKKMDDPRYDYEMAKMAVLPKAQGKKIGWLLGQAVVRKAKELGASSIYLESNTLLIPAINLYHKMGFQQISGLSSLYKRVDIRMELILDNN